MPKDDYENVKSLFPDLGTRPDFEKMEEKFLENCKNHAILDVMAQTQTVIAELGDEKLAGLVTIVVTKDATENQFAYTPSIYEDDNAFAMTLANLRMLERHLQDEAEDHKIGTMTEDFDDI